MSLIQEALKRQQMEQQGNSPAEETPASPAAPPPPPPPPASPPSQPTPSRAKSNDNASLKFKSRSNPEEEKPAEDTPHDETPSDKKDKPSQKTWTTLLGASIGVVLLLACGIWLISLAVKQMNAKKQQPASQPVETTENTIITTESESGPQPDIQETTQIEQPEPQTTSSDLETNLPPESQMESEEKGKQPQIAPETVRWPPLELSGIVGKGANGSAIINGMVLSVNESIENVTIVAIENQGVRLEYKGHTQYLRVGQSTQ